MPIVEWTDTRIVVAAVGCSIGTYLIGIRDRDPRDWARARHSNEVLLTVTLPPPEAQPAPPALGVDPSGRTKRGIPAIGRASIDAVFPLLAGPGGVLDVYGLFPFADPATDRVRLDPIEVADRAHTPPFVLTPVFGEISSEHVRVGLDDDVPAGSYRLTFWRGGRQWSEGRDIVVRSLTPASWEMRSRLAVGLDLVDYRLSGAVALRGVERRAAEADGTIDVRRVDVHGVHLGSTQEGRSVWVVTNSERQQQLWNFRTRDDSGAIIYPTSIAQGARVLSWSDTRIRVEHTRGPGRYFVIVGVPDAYRWSNAVQLTVR